MFIVKAQKILSYDLLAKVGAYVFEQGSKCSRKLSSVPQEKWHLLSAAFVERPPIITAEMTKLEKEVSSLFASVEREKSKLSNHGLRHKEDQKKAKERKDDSLEYETDEVLQTAQEMEDAWQEEFEAFQFAPRITEADISNDVKSLERKLDKKLVLLMQQQLGEDKRWVVPMGLRQNTESMREAAERVLSEFCGSELKAEFLGNAPCGFYQYRYPPGTYEDYIGAKIFFFKAHYISGPMVLKQQSPDYKWITKEEIKSLTPSSYGSKLMQFIIE